MKSWLGVVGRACLEFAIILVLISFAAGVSASIPVSAGGLRLVYKDAFRAALDLVPLAALLTLFLAFFSFELRIKSRAAGLLGLVFLGLILFSAGIGLRRLPLLRELASVSVEAKPELRLQEAGLANQVGDSVLWIGSYSGGEAIDAVSVDFASDYPRLAYSSRAPLDLASGAIDVQGRSSSAALAEAEAPALVPEAAVFAGSWFWDRLASMDAEPLYLAFASVGGFLLLALACRFLCRLTLWPLANAILAAAGLVGLVALDALLSGPDFLGLAAGLSARLGLFVPDKFLLPSIEGLVGLLVCAIDLAAAYRPKAGRHA